MSDKTFIIDTSSVQLGQVIRINITDQGIFRVFYNDISGNMYCALSRGSNYKQVVYNSSQNRTVMDNSMRVLILILKIIMDKQYYL